MAYIPKKLRASGSGLPRKGAQAFSLGVRTLLTGVCLPNLRELTVHHIDHDHFQ